jgi:hypothetical protein
MHMMAVMMLSSMMSICRHLITREWLDGFSWNFVWMLHYWKLLQTHIFKYTNATWDHDDAITHDLLHMGSDVITLLPQWPWIPLLFFLHLLFL